ncbi:nucleoporin Nup49 [Seiridium cupressi]
MAASFCEDDRCEQEEPIDEYARNNGLTIDSMLDALEMLSVLYHMDGLSDTSQVEERVHPFQIPSFSSLEERPTVTKASVDLLNQLQHREDTELITRSLLPMLGEVPRLKALELPLLQTEFEVDSLELKREIKARMAVNIRGNPPPAEPLDTSLDESLDFPDSARSYYKELSEVMIDERIAITKSAMDCLKRAVQDTLTDAEAATLLAETRPAKSSRARQMTPPLSPLELQEDYFIPDPDASQVPILSDPSTLLDADIDDAHAALLQDQPSPPQPPILRFSPFDDVPIVVTDTPTAKSQRLEEPLTPIDMDGGLPSALFDAKQALTNLALTEVNSDLDSDPRHDLDDMLSDDIVATFQEAAATAIQSVEQEQLEWADAVARLPVPVMDFTIQEPRWVNSGFDTSRHFQTIMISHSGARVPSWPEDHKARLQLQWIPFPSKLGTIRLEEAIETTDSQSCLDLQTPQSVLNSSTFVWKQPGLAILKETEDEELLEADHTERVRAGNPSPIPGIHRETLQALARKRTNEAGGNAVSDSTAPQAEMTTLPPPESRPCASKRRLLGFNDPLASSTLLTNFLDFHNSKRRKLGESSFFQKSHIQDISQPKVDVTKTSRVEETREAISTEALERPIKHAACPYLKAEGVPANIIVALTLSRGLLSWMEKLLPYVKITERDFDRWNSVTWGHKSVARSPIISSLAAEADMIVSPSTGIINTTLLKAMQQPLPGQKGKVSIRERIEKVSLRYERLIILVSQDNRQDESVRDLTGTECAAFSDFSGYVAGQDADTQVHYIGGGEETLSRWLAYFIARYSQEASKVDDLLIESETTWELVLRRAGMNAFAAQIVLSTLKNPSGISEGDDGHRGLAAFINMSPQERRSKFGQLLGGERVLRRVGAALDASWDEHKLTSAFDNMDQS